MVEGPGRRGWISFIPAEDLEKLEVPETSQRPLVVGLAGHLQSRWQAAKRAKEEIQNILLACMRQRDGKYPGDKLAQIKAAGMSEVFIRLTDIKCRALESWIKDIMTPPGERPFSLDHTPVADLPPEVEQKIYQEMAQKVQMLAQSDPQAAQGFDWEEIEKDAMQAARTLLNEEARTAAEDLTREIDDDLTEGRWYEAIDELAYDISTFPAAFLDGPIPRNKAVMEWKEAGPTVVTKVVKEYDRVSPFDVFPSPGAKSLNDGYYFIRERLRRSDLNRMIGVDGYEDSAIESILADFGGSGYKLNVSSDQEQSELESRHQAQDDPEGIIESLKFCGPIQGTELVEWGVDGIEDPTMDYEIQAHMVGSTVYSVVLNPHPLGNRTLRSASFKKSNDSIWGQGVPQIMSDIQDICNACARAMVNNMGMSSGPQVWAWANLMDPSKPITTLKPWDMHLFNSDEHSSMGSREPMGFFQPNPVIDVLLALFRYFYDLASEVTGVPAYIYGEDNLRGAGKTASGLSMLMNAASKGLKMVIGHIDKGIIKPSVYDHWVMLMLDEPQLAKGDINVKARASEYLIMMEQLQLRRMEWLNVTNNPIDMGIIGEAGRAEVLKESAKALKMPVDRIVPDRRTIESRMQNQQIQQIVMNISQATGINPEQLMAIAGGQQPQMQQLPSMAAMSPNGAMEGNYAVQ